MEDHTTTDSTLAILHELRQDFPSTGAVLQAYLRRTEQDCKDLAYAGSRVRLCKGAYKEPESVAFQGKAEVRLSYVRCLKALMAGDGYPMVASHDPKLIEIAGALVEANHREKGTYEYQMLFGIRPDEQKRLAADGEKVRVYVPYGDQWYGYLMRRLAEKPSNLGVLRAVAGDEGLSGRPLAGRVRVMSGRSAVVYDDGLTRYNFGPGHPMAPIRVDLTMRLARSLGVFDNPDLQLVAGPTASDEELVAGPHRALHRDRQAAERPSRRERPRRTAWAPRTTRSSRGCTTPRRTSSAPPWRRPAWSGAATSCTP